MSPARPTRPEDDGRGGGMLAASRLPSLLIQYRLSTWFKRFQPNLSETQLIRYNAMTLKPATPSGPAGIVIKRVEMMVNTQTAVIKMYERKTSSVISCNFDANKPIMCARAMDEPDFLKMYADYECPAGFKLPRDQDDCFAFHLAGKANPLVIWGSSHPDGMKAFKIVFLFLYSLRRQLAREIAVQEAYGLAVEDSILAERSSRTSLKL